MRVRWVFGVMFVLLLANFSFAQKESEFSASELKQLKRLQKEITGLTSSTLNLKDVFKGNETFTKRELNALQEKAKNLSAKAKELEDKVEVLFEGHNQLQNQRNEMLTAILKAYDEARKLGTASQQGM